MGGRGGRRYSWDYQEARRRLFTQLQAQGVTAVPCSVCGQMVDLSVTGRSAAARSIDHRLALSRGGSLLDLGAWDIVHLRCNSAKGADLPHRHERGASRDW